MALLIAACASPAPTPSSTPAASATPTPQPFRTATAVVISLLPAPGTELAAGNYAGGVGGIGISFTVGDGWTTVQQHAGFFDIQDDPSSLDVVAVQFASVPGTYDDAVDQVMSQPNTRVVESEDSTIDGIKGTVVVVETTDPPDTEPPVFRTVLRTAAGPISIASGRRLWISLLPVGNGVVAVLVGGSIAEWDRALELAEPVLESIVIGADVSY